MRLDSLDQRTKEVVSKLQSVANDLRVNIGVALKWQQEESDIEYTQNLLDLEIDVEEKAGAVLLLLEENWRKDFERGVSEAVSDGLSMVFGEDLEFLVESGVRAGQSAVKFSLLTPNGPVDIVNAEGGSLAQVCGFLLRVILLLAFQPPMRRIVVLDEAFSGVSEDNVPQLGALLREIVDETGIQIILVTHDPRFGEQADTVYEVERATGAKTATVTRLKGKKDLAA